MSVELIVEPGNVYEWPEFIDQAMLYPVGSIALDGAVRYRPATKWVTSLVTGREITVQNFDHHHGVDRLCTGSTMEQVEVAQEGGDFTEAYRDENGDGFEARVYVNASDPDVAGSVYLLKTDTSNWPGEVTDRLTTYIEVEGLMDRFGGMYVFKNGRRVFLETLNWIHQDFHEAQLNGDSDSPDPDIHNDIIERVGFRINEFAWGKSESIPLDTKYETIEDHGSWKVIKEQGSQGRLGAVEDGAKALVIVRDRKDGKFTYTLWRKSRWIRPFDLPLIYRELNDLEEDMEDGSWGASECIGGSPRGQGSSLSPEIVAKVISEVVDVHSKV